MARPQETPLHPQRLNFGSTPLQREPAPRHVYTFEEAQRRRSPAIGGSVTARVAEQMRELSLGSAMPQAPGLGQQHSTAGKEIRLWDPSFVPLNARSVSHQDYVPHPLPPMATPARAEYVPSDARCEGTSTTHSDYRAWPVQPPPPKPQPPPPPPAARFEGVSESHSAYVPKPLPPAMTPARAEYVPSDARCEGTSTTHSDYRAWPIQPPPPKPQPPPPPPAARFEGVSETRAQYGAKPLPPAYTPARAEYVPSDARCEGMSTTQSDYRAWPIQLPPPKPQPPPPPPAARFEGVSESHSAYVPKPLPPAVAPARAEYVPSPARFEDETETKRAYRAIALPPNLPLALGVQTQGSEFHQVVPRGARPPASGSAIFTTCLDNQTEVRAQRQFWKGGIAVTVIHAKSIVLDLIARLDPSTKVAPGVTLYTLALNHRHPIFPPSHRWPLRSSASPPPPATSSAGSSSQDSHPGPSARPKCWSALTWPRMGSCASQPPTVWAAPGRKAYTSATRASRRAPRRTVAGQPVRLAGEREGEGRGEEH
jgi:hypothetical protein